MKTVGVVAGSFDPITKGHEWLIKEAFKLVDELHVVVGSNPAKKYTFENKKRLELVESCVQNLNIQKSSIHVHLNEKDLLITFSKSIKATHIIRGVRSLIDFNYETSLADINRQIDSSIQTVYLVPPSELATISSSTVKGLIGFNGWEEVASNYVSNKVLAELINLSNR